MAMGMLLLGLTLLSTSVLAFLQKHGSSSSRMQTRQRQRQGPGQLHMNGRVPYVPFYPDKASKDYQWMDIYNALGRTRTLFVGRFLDDESCNQLIASLLWLEGQSSNEPITMYFNSPGALGKPSWAVYDVMTRMNSPIKTINMGLTVGMGGLLCAAGTPGLRYAYPNARFLMGKAGLDDGLQGQASGLALAVKEVLKDNVKLIDELARLCGQPPKKIENDMRRDFYLTAPEAAAYGVIDEVMMPPSPVKIMRHRGSDDEFVTFGHFSEARKVKAGPMDVVATAKTRDSDFDDYAAEQMAKKGFEKGRIDPKSLRNGGGANRFANSRCKPIPTKVKKEKTPIADKDGNPVIDEFDENPFKGAF